MHLAVDTHGMPIRAIITDGTTADCSQASDLIQGLSAQAFLADRGYDSNLIIQQALDPLMQPIIPPKKNRIVQRNYCKKNYKKRHLVENAFLHIKRWRGIATRYAKNACSFLAAIHIRFIAIWINS